VYHIASQLSKCVTSLELDFSSNQSVNVSLLSQVLDTIPISKVSLRNCASIQVKDVRILLRHLTYRECSNILEIDIRETPASSGNEEEAYRLESLARHAGVRLLIH
jgi:hypothetical protein